MHYTIYEDSDAWFVHGNIVHILLMCVFIGTESVSPEVT